jgi:hypothetical protein
MKHINEPITKKNKENIIKPAQVTAVNNKGQ